MATVLILLLVGLALFLAGACWKLAEGWRYASGQDLLTDLEGEVQELQELAVTKARMLRDIKDLEFDFQTGHVSPEDYNDMRRKLEARAIVVLKRLDELRGEVDYDAIIDREYDLRFDERPERAATPRPASAKAAAEPRKKTSLAKGSGDSASSSGARPRSGAKGARPKAAAQGAPAASRPSAPACGACGSPLKIDSRFCSVCGARVEAAAASPIVSASAATSVGEA